MSASDQVRCSFCGAPQHEVERVIVGPARVDGIENCQEIIREERERGSPVLTAGEREYRSWLAA